MEKLVNSLMFAGVPLETIERLTRKLPVRTFKKNETIIRQGDTATVAYFLIDGKVAVNYEAQDGNKTTVMYHFAPYIFGEIEILEGARYVGNVVALSACKTLVLS